MKLKVGNEGQQSDVVIMNEKGKRLGYIFSRADAEHITTIVNDYNNLTELLYWIKKCYEYDFTEEELRTLKPRDKAIYESVKNIF